MVLALLMIVAASVYRLVADSQNFAPIGALALLGGMYFGRRYALAVPVAILVITDIILNLRMNYAALYWPRLIDYGAFVLIGMLGLWARNRNLETKIGAAAATPFSFFLLSNFGVWLFGVNLAGQPYAKTFAGLAECYVAAIPFMWRTMLGDWTFMTLFALAILVARRADSRQLRWLVAEAKT